MSAATATATNPVTTTSTATATALLQPLSLPLPVCIDGNNDKITYTQAPKKNDRFTVFTMIL